MATGQKLVPAQPLLMVYSLQCIVHSALLIVNVGQNVPDNGIAGLFAHKVVHFMQSLQTEFLKTVFFFSIDQGLFCHVKVIAYPIFLKKQSTY